MFGYVMCVKWNQHDCQEAKVSQQNTALKEDGRSEEQGRVERDANLVLSSFFFFLTLFFLQLFCSGVPGMIDEIEFIPFRIQNPAKFKIITSVVFLFQLIQICKSHFSSHDQSGDCCHPGMWI